MESAGPRQPQRNIPQDSVVVSHLGNDLTETEASHRTIAAAAVSRSNVI